MAIDSERKRKSIAAIGHIPIGPVIVPDGSFAQGDRQAIGYSYYGINAAAPPGAGNALQLVNNQPLASLINGVLVG